MAYECNYSPHERYWVEEDNTNKYFIPSLMTLTRHVSKLWPRVVFSQTFIDARFPVSFDASSGAIDGLNLHFKNLETLRSRIAKKNTGAFDSETTGPKTPE